MNIPKTKVDTFYTGLIGAGLGYALLKKITQKQWASYVGGFVGYIAMSYGLFNVVQWVTNSTSQDVNQAPKVPVADVSPPEGTTEIPTTE